MNPAWITGLTAIAGLTAAGCLWVLRHIVRDELEPLRQDVETLRVAVFNHLSHDQPATETDIRERLGYGDR
ncbi:MAG TPA: hypothetical protein VN709_04000 [Terriglobales bacterium]|nr:hypothetical protein [Terriglobales bacterium]